MADSAGETVLITGVLQERQHASPSLGGLGYSLNQLSGPGNHVVMHATKVISCASASHNQYLGTGPKHQTQHMHFTAGGYLQNTSFSHGPLEWLHLLVEFL
jgi:hypothetical protein